METCHNCSEIVEKLNKEYDVLFTEKELYKNKCNEKNDLIISMIKKEYIRMNEIIEKRKEIVNDVGIYNVCCGQITECRNFIVDLFKLIK